jgi:hypothetical protein
MGAYPQCQSWAPGYDRGAADSVYRVNLHGPLPDRIALDGIVLAPGASKTDFLSTAFTNPGLLVSEPARALIERLSLGSHRFYPATVIDGASRLAHDLLLVPPTPWSELGFVSATLENTWPRSGALRQLHDLPSFEHMIASEPDWRPIELELEGVGAAVDVLRPQGPWRPFGSRACFEAIATAALTGLLPLRQHGLPSSASPETATSR